MKFKCCLNESPVAYDYSGIRNYDYRREQQCNQQIEDYFKEFLEKFSLKLISNPKFEGYAVDCRCTPYMIRELRRIGRLTDTEVTAHAYKNGVDCIFKGISSPYNCIITSITFKRT